MDNNVGARIQALIDNKQYHDACSIAEAIGPFVGFRDEVRGIIWELSNLCIDLAFDAISEQEYDKFADGLMTKLREKFDGFRSASVPAAVVEALLDMFPLRSGSEVLNQEPVDSHKYEEDLAFVKNLLGTVTRKYVGTPIKQPENFDVIAKNILDMMILDGYEMTHVEFYNTFNKYLDQTAR
jgi:citrate synthase